MLFSVSIVMIDKGASFCHVDNIIAVGQDIIFIVGGNQKWQGAAPIFIRRLRRSVEFLIVEFMAVIYIIAAVRRRVDLTAWIKK